MAPVEEIVEVVVQRGCVDEAGMLRDEEVAEVADVADVAAQRRRVDDEGTMPEEVAEDREDAKQGGCVEKVEIGRVAGSVG